MDRRKARCDIEHVLWYQINDMHNKIREFYT